MPAERGEHRVSIESRQEGTTVKLMTNAWRPSALTAVCAPVSGVPVSHAAMGSGLGVGTLQIQARRAQVQGRTVATHGPELEDTAKVETIFGDVRGVPPRGRPV